MQKRRKQHSTPPDPQINASRFCARRIRTLRRGSAKPIGKLTVLRLWLQGRRDGMRGLPRQTQDDRWTSPAIEAECLSYEETCDKLWGSLLIESREAHDRLRVLAEQLRRSEKAHSDLAERIHAENRNFDDTCRRNGEEKLTPEQIAARRGAELSRRLASLNSELHRLDRETESVSRELTCLRGSLQEADGLTRVICERLRKHTRQRIAIYWDAAMSKHPNRGKQLPVLPAVKLADPDSEGYQKVHSALLSEIDALLAPKKPDNDPKEVA